MALGQRETWVYSGRAAGQNMAAENFAEFTAHGGYKGIVRRGHQGFVFMPPKSAQHNLAVRRAA